MGPGSGAQRRRFGEPGLSSAASNSMGRFNVAPHAMPLTGQGPGADAAVTAAQPPPAQRSSRAKPAPMAPPAPGSGAGPASCDVTGVPTARPGVGSRKRATLGGSISHSPPPAPPPEEMERPGRRTWSPGNEGKAPASAPPRVPTPTPSLAAAPGWPLRFSHLRGTGLGEGRARIGKLRGVCGEASGSVSGGPVTSDLALAPG